MSSRLKSAKELAELCHWLAKESHASGGMPLLENVAHTLQWLIAELKKRQQGKSYPQQIMRQRKRKSA